MGYAADKLTLRLPAPHSGGQEIFLYWNQYYPEAQCLVTPCGTKTGKTYGSVLWLLTEAMSNKNFYCAWIAPTYLKCKIGYRYMKSMLPDHAWINLVDGRLEIQFANGSFIKFLHGSDAETTIEGEGIDRFVIDEAGKIKGQVWISLLTTITQTKGKGIVTGTPRGFTWYSDLYKRSLTNDPFFVGYRLPTSSSPFVPKESIERAKKLLPHHLFDQYYNAQFISHGSTFGDLSHVWDDTLEVKPQHKKFWIHPDESLRKGSIVHGLDIAKKHDYTVFYSVNTNGKLVGFCRFKHVPYTHQIIRLKTYITNYFSGDQEIRFDATGVGIAFEDMLAEAEIDAIIEPVIFTNKSKSEMVTKVLMAIQSDWHKAPKIEIINNEFSSYELSITPSGLHKYSAPEGEHDDVVSAALMAISGAYSSASAEDGEKFLESALSGNNADDILSAYAMTGTDNEFFESQDYDDDFSFDYENE